MAERPNTSPASAPAPLPLFYRSVVPLDRERHRTLTMPAVPAMRFAAASHLVPAVVDEFASACASLPILFVPDTEGVTPVFLVGVEPGRNALVTDDGGWTGGAYLPAYLRRYPFILGEVAGAAPLLCIDEQADGLRQPSRDVDAGPAADGADSAEPRPMGAADMIALFSTDGADAPMLVERMRLATDYAVAAERTQAFCRLLVELKLLQPITVQRGAVPASTSPSTAADAGDFARPGGPSSVIYGLLAVSEPALAALPETSFLRLRVEGYLGAVYTHLVSLRAIERLPA